MRPTVKNLHFDRLPLKLALSIAVTIAYCCNAWGQTPPPPLLQEIRLSCATTPLIASSMASRHIIYKDIDDEIINRVVELETKSLDPTKVLLTQKEFDEVAKTIRPIVIEANDRDCSKLFELKKQEKLWQKALEDDVRNILKSKHFKVRPSTTIELDVDKRRRPRSKKEQRKLRDKILQLQMANLMAGGINEKEAKKKLIHRYELATKRVGEISSEDILGSLLNAYALALDPHSLYFSPDDIKDFQIQMGLSLTGIGATLQSQDGFTVVKDLTPGGPADRQGELKTGDKIVAVAQGKNGEPIDIIDMDLKDVVKKIRGDKGTWVVLTVLRPGKKVKRLKIEIQRDKIELKDQAAKITYHNIKRGNRTLKIALLDLPSFYAGSPPDGRDSAIDVAALLKEANAANADGLVVDLSRNGGGSLQSAIQIVGQFLRVGAVVGVGDGTTKPEVMSDLDPTINWDKPVAVLISNLSASASEIFAGALKDYDRALVVGDKRTFGKGTVQQLLPLPSELGVVKVTTSKFFLPGGNSTQLRGVTSDIIVPSPFSYFDIGEDEEEYALPAGNVLSFLSERKNTGISWIPIDRTKLAGLASKSKARMAKIKEFNEIAKNKKEKNERSIIKISEILKDHDKDNSDNDKDKDKKDKISPQATETINILADYIELTGFTLHNTQSKTTTVVKISQDNRKIGGTNK